MAWYMLAAVGMCAGCWVYARIEAYLAIRRMAADIHHNAEPQSSAIHAIRLHGTHERKRFATYIPDRHS